MASRLSLLGDVIMAVLGVVFIAQSAAVLEGAGVLGTLGSPVEIVADASRGGEPKRSDETMVR